MLKLRYKKHNLVFNQTPLYYASRHFSISTARMAARQITLTPPEKLFRQCLLDCRDAMRSVHGMKDLDIRWTGGWVRDKLLDVQSHDIDVALSTMTGMQYATALRDFMARNGASYENEAKQQGFKADIKNIHKIAANPEKSKHLETVTTKMFGIDVDFVNLRKEVYDEVSRNPQMEFGTAEEDAMRRDATVNALFYNLDSQRIEDFTQKGLDDMAKKIIRTPLAPYQTFKDDPLRVLRLIRFACRLGYEIEDESKEAMKDKSIHEALRLKISRERVGVEVGKIFAGPDPYTGLTLINDLDLYSTVFADPAYDDWPDRELAQTAYFGLQTLLKGRPDICFSLHLQEDAATAWFLAAYVPWATMGNKAYTASREGIKATNQMSKLLDDAIKAQGNINQAVMQVHNGSASRGSVGMVLRASKAAWRQHVLFSLLSEIAQTDYKVSVDLYHEFLTYVQDQKLEDAYTIDKHVVLKGNEIKAALGDVKQGPWLKQAVDMIAEWQFDQMTPTKEQALEMIKSRRAELNFDQT